MSILLVNLPNLNMKFVILIFIIILNFNVCVIKTDHLECFVGPPLTLPMAPCTGEAADICGFLPSTYPELGVGPGVPPLCDADCSLIGEFDKCGVCTGLDPITQQLLEPTGLPDMTRVGGSVANWNGSVAIAQHINQEYTPLINAPVITWTLDDTTGQYEVYQLPTAEGDTAGDEDRVPLGKGQALIMSEHYLIVGSHDAHPRLVQLWTRTCSPPWSWTWTANDPCPGNLFGFDVAIDERVPKLPDQGIFGTVVAGDPAAFFSGRVYVYYTYSPGILQTLFYGSGNETERICFGNSVSADSGFLAIGAPALDYGGQTNSGSVFIYQWNPAAGLQGEYEFRVQITPPFPLENGGFGQDVGVYDDTILIGDNQHTIFLYRMVGAIAVPLTIDNPTGLNLISRLGYTVSIWDQYAVAGDENFIISPSARGATFVYDRNPLSPTTFRPMYTLSDAIDSLNTRYGASVDVRGGCYVASGVPAQTDLGGVYVADICRFNCYGCDGVLNSCEKDDFCDVCGGDNSTCIDCFGVIGGIAVPDACGVCEGDNSTCILPFANPPSIIESCESGQTVELRHEFEEQWGAATFELVAPLPTKGIVVIENSGSLDPLPTLTYTGNPMETGADSITLNATVIATQAHDTFVIPVTIGSCVDCFGVIDGPARLDECGVCDGDNSTCSGCDGIPNSGLVFDYCGVCGGDNTTCVNITIPTEQFVDCTAQIIFQLEHEPSALLVFWEIIVQPMLGQAFVNHEAGVILYENPAAMGHDWFIVKVTSRSDDTVMDTANITFLIDDCMDCSGEQGGTQIVDLCGVCGGDGSSCADCLGIPNGGAAIDICNICNGDGQSCLDCAGVPFGPSRLDVCGVCGGDNSTCGVASGMSFQIFIFLGLFFILVMLMWCCCTYTFDAVQRLNTIEENKLNESTITLSNQSEILRPSQALMNTGVVGRNTLDNSIRNDDIATIEQNETISSRIKKRKSIINNKINSNNNNHYSHKYIIN